MGNKKIIEKYLNGDERVSGDFSYNEVIDLMNLKERENIYFEMILYVMILWLYFMLENFGVFPEEIGLLVFIWLSVCFGSALIGLFGLIFSIIVLFKKRVKK